MVYQSQSNMRAAENEYKKAIRLDPQNSMAYYALGVCYGLQKKFNGACSVLEKAVRLAPDDVKVLLALAHASKEEQRFARAAEMFDRAARSSGRDDLETCRQAAQCYYRAGDFERAVGMYERMIAQDHHHPEGYQGKGAALVMLERWAEVASCVEKAIDLGSDSPQRYALLGLAYFELRDPKRAAAALRKAVEEDPHSVELRLRLGDALRGTGDYHGAEAEARRVLGLSPGNAAARQLLDAVHSDASQTRKKRNDSLMKALDTGNIIQLVINRERIREPESVAVFVDVLNNLLKDAATVRAGRGRLVFVLEGFEDKTREVDEIPEIRQFFDGISEQFPYWFWFVTTEGPFLKHLLYCLCEIEWREAAGDQVGRQIEGDEIVRFMITYANALEDLGRRFGLSDREIEERFLEVDEYYRRALGR